MNKKGKRKQKKPRHTKNEYSEINDWELRTNIAIAMTLTEKAKSFALDLPSHSLLRYSIEIEMFRWIEFSTSMPSFNGRYNIKWQNILRIHNSVPLPLSFSLCASVTRFYSYWRFLLKKLQFTKKMECNIQSVECSENYQTCLEMSAAFFSVPQ